MPFEQKGLAKQIVHTSLARNIKKGGVIKMFKIKKIKLNQNFINLVGIHRCFIAYSNNDDEYWFFSSKKKSTKLKELHMIGHEFATNCELKHHIKD